MLALHPHRVRLERAVCGHMAPEDARQQVIERIMNEGFATVTPGGVLGDARGATARLGEAWIAGLADGVAARLAIPEGA